MICAHCCGTKRLVEIDCPQSCVYLTGAHAPAWEGRETEKRRDARRVLPHMQELSEPQARLFFLTLLGVQAIRARRPDLEDALLEEAVAALRRTVETRTRGVLYEHQAQDARAQGLILELRQIFESKDEAGRAVAPEDRDLLAALSAVDGGLRQTLEERESPTAFLDTTARLVGRMQAGAPAPDTKPPLIVEP
jgi:hypothetical protein